MSDITVVSTLASLIVCFLLSVLVLLVIPAAILWYCYVVHPVIEVNNLWWLIIDHVVVSAVDWPPLYVVQFLGHWGEAGSEFDHRRHSIESVQSGNCLPVVTPLCWEHETIILQHKVKWCQCQDLWSEGLTSHVRLTQVDVLSRALLCPPLSHSTQCHLSASSIQNLLFTTKPLQPYPHGGFTEQNTNTTTELLRLTVSIKERMVQSADWSSHSTLTLETRRGWRSVAPDCLQTPGPLLEFLCMNAVLQTRTTSAQRSSNISHWTSGSYPPEDRGAPLESTKIWADNKQE